MFGFFTLQSTSSTVTTGIFLIAQDRLYFVLALNTPWRLHAEGFYETLTNLLVVVTPFSVILCEQESNNTL